MKIGVFGLGRWGPRLIGKMLGRPLIAGVSAFDIDGDRRSRVATEYPDVAVADDERTILEDPSIDAVVVATPVRSHFDIARKALENDKHVLCEKPLTGSVDEASALVELASRRDLRLMVDHITVYSGAVQRLKEIVDAGELGEIQYIDAVRSNLGMLQQDVSVIWDLAIHDFAIIDRLMNEMPVAVSGTGAAFYGPQEEVACASLFFNGGAVAYVHASWISPVKIRRVLVGGKKRMALFDDTRGREKLLLFDSGVEAADIRAGAGEPFKYRSAEARPIVYSEHDTMDAMLDEFIRAVTQHRDPMTDGRAGLRMVNILSAVARSLAQQGERLWLTRNEK